MARRRRLLIFPRERTSSRPVARLKPAKNQPTLVVNGHNDIMVPTINSFTLSQKIPNAQLIIYPDSGHGSLFQFPELFVTHATIFLDGPFAGTGP